jgi:transposase
MEAGMQRLLRLKRMKRVRQGGLFDLPQHLQKISENGDPLEVLSRAVDFEVFRPVLEDALGYSDGTKGGRPPYDPVAMLKILLLQAQHDLSEARAEFMTKDRLSWMRFLGFGLNEPTPDESTIRHFRNRLTRVGVIEPLFYQLDAYLRSCGYLPMGGQIVDATLVAAPRQGMTQEEKDQAKEGKSAVEIWPDKPAKAAQKHRSPLNHRPYWLSLSARQFGAHHEKWLDIMGHKHFSRQYSTPGVRRTWFEGRRACDHGFGRYPA